MNHTVNIHFLNQCFLHSHYVLGTGLWARHLVGWGKQTREGMQDGPRIWAVSVGGCI